ncbi:hypothetical protein GCM10009836_25080 [Pseudonocardia ailaonensis]|uniref:DUF222 domain-containing protein n=1 Tax=Pseudonocardia ailaonensis TaxID=367279 RepID=A0ABN2N031_9PSEU
MEVARPGLHGAISSGVQGGFDRVLDAVAVKLPKVCEHLDAARADVLAFTSSSPDLVEQPQRAAQPRDPPPHRRGRIFPDRDSLTPLVGAVLAERHERGEEHRIIEQRIDPSKLLRQPQDLFEKHRLRQAHLAACVRSIRPRFPGSPSYKTTLPRTPPRHRRRRASPQVSGLTRRYLFRAK